MKWDDLIPGSIEKGGKDEGAGDKGLYQIPL